MEQIDGLDGGRPLLFAAKDEVDPLRAKKEQTIMADEKWVP